MPGQRGIGKLETEAQLLDFVREELLGTIPERLQQAVSALALLGVDRLNVGVGSITWPGATATSNLADIPHGLGVVPVFFAAILTGTGTFGSQSCVYDSANSDATNARIRFGSSVNIAASTMQLVWIAAA